MKAKTKKIITITLIIAWMVVVFYFSHQQASDSSELSGEITEVILKVFNVLEKETLEQQTILETIIRKLAHYTLYTIGGILLFLHMNLYELEFKQKVMVSWLIGTSYAITDEIHQLFVLGRSGEIRDVCIDSLGVLTGIIVVLMLLKAIHKNYNNSNDIKIDKKYQFKI